MSSADGTSKSDCPVILLDIEGTTTSISFVKDVLFPFARKEMANFLDKNWDDSEVQSIILMVRKQSEEDVSNGLLEKALTSESNKDALLPEILKYLFCQMDMDRKTTGLKALQGKIWKSGFENGILKGHVYEDVPPALERWTRAGKKVYIYSSGSVEAQVLLFKYSEAGDLTKYLSGYFDTTTGPKVESISYKTISDKIGVIPQDIAFYTDVPKEAYAAIDADCLVVLSIRPGNAQLTDQELNDFPNVQNFHMC